MGPHTTLLAATGCLSNPDLAQLGLIPRVPPRSFVHTRICRMCSETEAARTTYRERLIPEPARINGVPAGNYSNDAGGVVEQTVLGGPDRLEPFQRPIWTSAERSAR